MSLRETPTLKQILQVAEQLGATSFSPVHQKPVKGISFTFSQLGKFVNKMINPNYLVLDISETTQKFNMEQMMLFSVKEQLESHKEQSIKNSLRYETKTVWVARSLDGVLEKCCDFCTEPTVSKYVPVGPLERYHVFETCVCKQARATGRSWIDL